MRGYPIEGRLVNRLSLFAERLIQISIDEKQFWTELADLGCISSTLMPVSPGDSAAVVRAKEALIQCRRRRERIVDALRQIGAEICDWETMEILLLGGPKENTFLSWMPGEPQIGWWRESKSVESRREHLPGLDSRDIGPNQH